MGRNFKLERLQRGESFVTSEKGNSMVPLINSGQDHNFKEFVNFDCDDLIEESYGDDLPDGGFDCKLYFLLKGKYYCVDISCGTRWEGGWSDRRNYIDGIEIKNITDFHLDEDKMTIKFI